MNEELELVKRGLNTGLMFVPDGVLQTELLQCLAAVERLEAERQSDTEILDWMEKQFEEWQYRADLAIQADEEDGIWFARIARVDCGALPQGTPYSPEVKTETVRAALRAAIESTKETANG